MFMQIYRRTWGTEAGASVTTGVEGDLGEACVSAVQSRICHLAARAQAPDHSHLMHK